MLIILGWYNISSFKINFRCDFVFYKILFKILTSIYKIAPIVTICIFVSEILLNNNQNTYDSVFIILLFFYRILKILLEVLLIIYKKI